MVLLASLTHVARGTIFLGLILVGFESLAILAVLAFLEFLAARWLWSLRIESWGVAAGYCIFHLLWPLVDSISPIAHVSVVAFCIAELIVLGVLRRDGLYSFVSIAEIDPIPLREASIFQRNVFNLVIVAQVFKGSMMLLSGLILMRYLDPLEAVPWLSPIPHVPLVITLGMLDLISSVGGYFGCDWAFQLILVMSPVGIAEALLTLSGPVALISPWIIMLLTTCLAKDGFYYRLQKRRRNSV